MSDKVKAITKISIHNYPEPVFNLLNLQYPGGKYFASDNYDWFELMIKGTDIQVTWFKED
jgi:hypothetical protein|tara:strand:- start:290 stop:469 length:180 start_codon:yes stop_codon:yes gene_type:complete